jgi:S1-C subfamily serine protease
MNTAIFSTSGNFAGIGFAVPVDTINRVVPRLIAYGRYIRPALGVITDADLSRQLLEALGVEGVLVFQVQDGSPAARAGLRSPVLTREGDLVTADVILAVNDRDVLSVQELVDVLDTFRVGDKVTLKVYRNGELIEVDVVLG